MIQKRGQIFDGDLIIWKAESNFTPNVSHSTKCWLFLDQWERFNANKFESGKLIEKIIPT